MTKSELNAIADRATEDGENAVVAACQALARTSSGDDERQDALTVVREYVESIRGGY